MADYDALLRELDDTILKAASVDMDDEKIEQAAAGADPTGEAAAKKKAAAERAAADGDVPMFAKSFNVTLEDGQELEAWDGTELVKSMQTVIAGHETTIKRLATDLAGANAAVSQVLPMLKSLAETVGKQGEHIRTLREAPGGRASVLKAPAAAPAGPLNRGELLAKALEASAAGRITGLEAASVETALNRGQAPHPSVLQRINAA